MIIYIHGFGSSGQGGKASQLRDYCKDIGQPFIAPSFSYIPELAMSTLEELVESYDEVTLIGSSLGGYYSIYLAEKYGLKAVLINPAVASFKTLKRAIDLTGYAMNHYDGSQFTWQERYIDMLKNYEVAEIEAGDYLLLLQTGDDVLNYRDTIEKLPHAQMVIEKGGTHPFEGIERHFELIRDFLLEKKCLTKSL